LAILILTGLVSFQGTLDQDGQPLAPLCDFVQHWSQIEISIGDIHRDEPIGGKPFFVELDRFDGQQVHRQGIIGKRVHDEEIEQWFLSVFPFFSKQSATIPHPDFGESRVGC
jgi:hypothetical protein